MCVDERGPILQLAFSVRRESFAFYEPSTNTCRVACASYDQGMDQLPLAAFDMIYTTAVPEPACQAIGHCEWVSSTTCLDGCITHFNASMCVTGVPLPSSPPTLDCAILDLGACGTHRHCATYPSSPIDFGCVLDGGVNLSPADLQARAVNLSQPRVCRFACTLFNGLPDACGIRNHFYFNVATNSRVTACWARDLGSCKTKADALNCIVCK